MEEASSFFAGCERRVQLTVCTVQEETQCPSLEVEAAESRSFGGVACRLRVVCSYKNGKHRIFMTGLG